MKIFTTIFLAASIFLQTFSTFFIKADFLLNQSYIEKNLCINRDKPMMHCNGKCYLAKKLREQEKQDQQIPASKNEKFDIIPFFVPTGFVFANNFSLIKLKFFNKEENINPSFSHSIFHPPSA